MNLPPDEMTDALGFAALFFISAYSYRGLSGFDITCYASIAGISYLVLWCDSA